MPYRDVPRTQFALKLQEAMDKENVSIAQLSKEIDMTYEYTRRLLKGMNTPSKMLLRILSSRFGWDFDDAHLMLVQDKFRLANGDPGAMAQAFNPEVEPFEKAWHLLDQNQKDILLAQFTLFLAQNRRSTRGGASKSGSAKQGAATAGAAPDDASKMDA